MTVQILYEERARRQFMVGVDALADIVSKTFGPRGRPVAIAQPGGLPLLLTRTGREVARHIELRDPFANLGVRALRQAATLAFDEAGDGSTATILLARRLIAETERAVRAGAPIQRLRREMFDAIAAIVRELADRAIACDRPEDMLAIARSAAQGDPEVAGVLVDAVLSAGEAARVALELGHAAEDQVEVHAGHTLLRGHRSTAFPLPAPSVELELTNAAVFVCAGALHSVDDVKVALEAALAARRPLMVFASAVAGDALRTLALNNAAGRVPCAAVTPPLCADDGRRLLEDIARLVGTHLAPSPGFVRDGRDLGSAARIRVAPETTQLDEPGGDPDELARRVRALKHQLDARTIDTRSPTAQAHEREQTQQQLRLLQPRTVTIRVGALGDAAARLRLGRFEAAHAALAGALREGTVPGGGAALVHAGAGALRTPRQPGAWVVQRSLAEPLRVIATSAGRSAVEVVRQVAQADNAECGFDASADALCDMFAAGVLDSARAVRLALMTAAGVAGVVADAAVMMTRKRAHDDIEFSPKAAAETREAFWQRPRGEPA